MFGFVTKILKTYLDLLQKIVKTCLVLLQKNVKTCLVLLQKYFKFVIKFNDLQCFIDIHLIN